MSSRSIRVGTSLVVAIAIAVLIVLASRRGTTPQNVQTAESLQRAHAVRVKTTRVPLPAAENAVLPEDVAARDTSSDRVFGRCLSMDGALPCIRVEAMLGNETLLSAEPTDRNGVFSIAIPTENRGRASIRFSGETVVTLTLGIPEWDTGVCGVNLGDVYLESGTSLSGQIFDPGGAAAAGALVSCENASDHARSGARYASTALSDSNGYYRLERIPLGTLRVSAVLSTTPSASGSTTIVRGVRDHDVRADVMLATDRSVDLTVDTADTTATTTVGKLSVRGYSYKPEFREFDLPVWKQDEGEREWRLGIPVGAEGFVVAVDGFFPVDVQVTSADSYRIILDAAAASVLVRLPACDMEFRYGVIERDSVKTMPPLFRLHHSHDDLYTAEVRAGLRPGAKIFILSDDHTMTGCSRALGTGDFRPGSPPIAIGIAKSGHADVVVRQAETEGPVSGAVIRVFQSPELWPPHRDMGGDFDASSGRVGHWSVIERVLTGSDGRARISIPPNRQVRLDVSHPGLAQAIVPCVGSGSSLELDLVSESRIEVRGREADLNSLALLSGARGGAILTPSVREEGTSTFRGLGPGTYVVGRVDDLRRMQGYPPGDWRHFAALRRVRILTVSAGAAVTIDDASFVSAKSSWLQLVINSPTGLGRVCTGEVLPRGARPGFSHERFIVTLGGKAEVGPISPGQYDVWLYSELSEHRPVACAPVTVGEGEETTCELWPSWAQVRVDFRGALNLFVIDDGGRTATTVIGRRDCAVVDLAAGTYRFEARDPNDYSAGPVAVSVEQCLPGRAAVDLR